MSYHGFKILYKLLNGDLATKIGQGIHSHDLMDGACNCSSPYKVNGKCVFKGKPTKICLIYEVNLTLCDTIYIGNKQQ